MKYVLLQHLLSGMMLMTAPLDHRACVKATQHPPALVGIVRSECIAMQKNARPATECAKTDGKIDCKLVWIK